MGKYIGLGAATFAALLFTSAKADIIVNPNSQHTEVGASNPKDIDIQYKQKHPKKIHDIDDDVEDSPDVDLKSAFDGAWITDGKMSDVDITKIGQINIMPPDPLDAPEPGSAALLIGALVGFILIRKHWPAKS